MMDFTKNTLWLLTEPESKRDLFFQKAAKELAIPLNTANWRDYASDVELPAGAIVKIDPPVYSTSDFVQMQGMLEKYVDFLDRIKKKSCIFLNSPASVLQLLDKFECKQILERKKISTTKMVAASVKTMEEMLDVLEKKRIYSVFIKPSHCSGAAGVVALQIRPHTGQMRAYTSAIKKDGHLVNTKRIRSLTNRGEIEELLDEIMKMDVIVEQWRPKDVFNGKSYDLRVVCQFGKVSYVIVRQSGGPITNLHLNNQALAFENLSFTLKQKTEIEELCLQATDAFPGLNTVGIDVLIDKNNKKPYIIEMNGQGDLLYQDIYKENRIYKEQLAWMEKMRKELI